MSCTEWSTHHNACDCREAALALQIQRAESEAAELREQLRIAIANEKEAMRVYQVNYERATAIEVEAHALVAKLADAVAALEKCRKYNWAQYDDGWQPHDSHIDAALAKLREGDR